MATIKKIAEKSGVSIVTVDRVIHNRGSVSKNAEEKVRKAIEELNYTPNIFARQLKLSKTYRFGIIIPELEQDSQYWQIPASGIQRAQQELLSHRIRIEYFHYDRYSQASFAKACEKALEANIDGLLMVPMMPSITEELIQKLPSDFPYVFFDSAVPNTGCLSCIIQDSFLSGQLAGRLMHLLVGERGCISAIRLLPQDFHIDERIRGFQHFFRDQSSVGLKIYDADLHGEPDRFVDLVDQIRKENCDLCGIFVSNALTFLVARALKISNFNKKIHVIGYDLIKENIEYLKRNYIDFIISQQSEQQGYQGIYTLFRSVVLNEAVPDKIMMPIDIITRENVDYYE